MAKRLGDLQQSTYRDLFVIEAFCVPKAKMYKIEKAVHQRIAERRIRGEWFNITDDVARLGIALEVKAAGLKPLSLREYEDFSARVRRQLASLNAPLLKRTEAIALGYM